MFFSKAVGVKADSFPFSSTLIRQGNLMSDSQNTSGRVSRRGALKHVAGGAAVAAMGALAQKSQAAEKEAGGKAVANGRIKQSIVHWCFSEHWDVERTAQIAKQLGCVSVELVAPEHFPTLKKYGLTCAIAPNGMPGAPFIKGFNNPKYHDEVIANTKKSIDACAEFGFPTVIAFNGFKYRDAEDPTSEEISLEEGAKNCVAGFKKILPYAEKKKVNISLEMLNTREATHPMKGHPGYQGDDTDYCIDIIREVDSPRLNLLFDIYHVQIMNGDQIRRIHQLKDHIGHVHTAGNPGRGELDESQEINYPPIMEALIEVGYQGYVGQEFIPTRDPLAGLTAAVKLCDV
jgi:hydroxypyruvate isomerase